uniref:Uncharacterized protein AlNc14C48G3832 n=1 Tax=Albugo laibachii Nc14 TaxID=890382 RepID=F0WAX1_9STRA|nr:conserved hypothetical protein [Albugo laibachii Nc14]CCA18433.1 conserved hypothetical protein [Albugo laibachii Nc14]|eukprot:CCA18433.1 conserved hypothetical protein [Albugo laibachii Nc14]
MALELRRRWSDESITYNRHLSRNSTESTTGQHNTHRPPSITKGTDNLECNDQFEGIARHSRSILEDQECVICLDTLINSGEALFTAECGHRYHFNCLLENINHDEANSDKCPICRKAQIEWPHQTRGLVNAHPFCTNCGKRGTGGQFCDGCGHSLSHTPTARDRARAAAAAIAARSSIVVECPTCRVRCLVNTNARGTLQCPNGHLFQVHTANGNENVATSAGSTTRSSLSAPHNFRPPPPLRPITGPQEAASHTAGHPESYGSGRVVMRQCPTCFTHVQMPPGSHTGQYMCPHGHTFHYAP